MGHQCCCAPDVPASVMRRGALPPEVVIVSVTVVVVGQVGPQAARATQLSELAAKRLAEDVVDERVVGGGALGEQARQQADERRHAVLAPGVEHGPETDRHVGCPGHHEASADQDSHLGEKERERKRERERERERSIERNKNIEA